MPFSIASMTEPMVTARALMLYEQGRFLMDDPISKYFPQFADTQVAVMSEDGQRIVDTVAVGRPITIQDLMRHTSGIIYGNRGTTAVHEASSQALSSPQATLSGPEFIDALATVPLLYQPGTVWDYGYSIDVVGQLIEHLSGQTLGEYLKANLFDPLGMTDTGFLLPDQDQDRYAQVLPEDPLSGRPQSTRDATTPLTFECGGGCAISTASDYLRFALMLLNDGALGDTRVLGRKTVEYMLSNHLGPDVENLIAAADPTRADYGFGLGLAVRTTPGVARVMGSVGDFSWPGATGTNWWADPEEELAVVFMSHAPGPIRWHYRQLINALVNQAIVD